MQVYLVGGAVRDAQLGIPHRERDWCVVGATPADLEAQGYRRVGKDFPVFLHPETGEEYALARTERKTAPGYHGFAVDCSPRVTIEEDLGRRDLTINAIAQDEDGKLIDPWGGLADIENRLLRHVGDAFVEDPVRILRVARFAARFAGLGFTIADETLRLMRRMVEDGEVDAEGFRHNLCSWCMSGVRGVVVGGSTGEAVLVPYSAVREDPRTGAIHVYVVEGMDGQAEPEVPPGEIPDEARPVTRRRVDVLSEGRGAAGVRGVEEGQWVVTLGQHLLDEVVEAVGEDAEDDRGHAVDPDGRRQLQGQHRHVLWPLAQGEECLGSRQMGFCDLPETSCLRIAGQI